MKTLFFNILPDWVQKSDQEQILNELLYEDYVHTLITFAQKDVPTCHITVDISNGRYVYDKNVYFTKTSFPLIHITVTGDDIDGVVNQIKEINDDSPISFCMISEYNLNPQDLESLTYLGRETDHYSDIEVLYDSKGKKMNIHSSQRIHPPCC